jgi:hypothetical protein
MLCAVPIDETTNTKRHLHVGNMENSALVQPVGLFHAIVMRMGHVWNSLSRILLTWINYFSL